MASGGSQTARGQSARRAKKPVDIALDAGMRPMLLKHGFQRKTNRYFVRETSSAVQYVDISPPDRREGYLTCQYDATAGIVSKEISRIASELNLGNRLLIHIKRTSRECHVECDLGDIERFHARVDTEKLRKTPFFLRPFILKPMIYDHIPEMGEFRALCKKIYNSHLLPITPETENDYAIKRAELFEKYSLAWFDQCDQPEYFVRWIEFWVGRRAKSKNLLLATACCLASDSEGARTILQKIVDLPEESFEKIYKRELRYEKEFGRYKTIEGRQRSAKKMANSIMTMRRRSVEDARILARYFNIELT